MKTALTTLFALAVAFALTLTAYAEEKKEVELKGDICCAKCELKLDGQTKCYTVIKVKEKKDNKDVDVVYWLDEESHKKNHGTICKECKEGTIKGTVSEKDGKKWVKVSKLEFKK